jgi:ATP-dependent helicase/nuclease subunit A
MFRANIAITKIFAETGRRVSVKMGKVKWSDEQKKAIEFSTEKSGSAIVSAAAGSGKTAMLVERIVRLLTCEKNRISADRIVAVTFTNDAAGELKTRLETAINALPKSPWLQEQLINLEVANICTISSFCLQILRDFAEEAGLKSDFRICEGKEAERLSILSLDFALERLYDGIRFSLEERNILKKITGEAGDSKLGAAVFKLHKEYIKQPFPREWLEEISALYLSKYGFNDLIEDEKKQPKINKKDITISEGLLADFDFVKKMQSPQVQLLKRLFEVYRDRFYELKMENNCVEFSDAEQLVLQILQNKNIAEKICESIYEIIVDEFQDSNLLQYEIFKKLSRDGKNMFFVGDVKQSIYRFRNADPRVFSSVTEDGNYTLLALNKNFRSSQEIINSVNEIFEKNMTKEMGGVDYNADTKLIFGLSTIARNDNTTELVIVENAENPKKAEANYIANRIREMVKSGFKITEKNGELRACNYGDFAILVSGLSTVENEFGTAFEARDIPFDKQKSGDYAEVAEVKIITALLTIIERPFEDMELLTVLMSPLYNFTAAEIANMRKSGVNKPLFENLKMNNAAGFLRDFKRWSAYLKDAGACKLVRLIYNEGVFFPLVATSKNPEKTLINIRLLLHYSTSLKSLTRDTLSGLVGVLKGSSGAVLEEARYSADDEKGKVKLMTIHASKGLEFPICFVARTNSRFVLRENYSDIIVNDKIGLAMRYIVPETRTRVDTLIHKKAREYNEKAAISEEIRKLYVACTRARDKLILTAAMKAEKPEKKSYFNWLLQTEIEKTTIQASEIEEKTAEKEIRIVHEKGAEKIIEATRKTYSREALTTIPRRFTATQIGDGNAQFSALDETQDEPTVFPRSASFMGDRKLTGKKRGDAYHKMMELLDFKNADIGGQIQNFKSYFTEEEFIAIEPEKIKMFFNSKLGRRACASEKVQKEYKLCTEISLSELGYSREFDALYEEEKPLVQGIADMFFYEDEEIILVDYKTNKNTSSAKLIEMYEKQLEIYARAISEMTGINVREKWIYSFEHGGIQLP